MLGPAADAAAALWADTVKYYNLLPPPEASQDPATAAGGARAGAGKKASVFVHFV
eukprot:COSAG06_NODE_7037_length_2663_cov_1.815984_5_plen_55_part_00